MTGSGDREEILARIRAALSGVNRHNGASVGAAGNLSRAGKSPAGPRPAPEPCTLLDEFSRASALVGVQVSVARTPDGARARVLAILDGEGAADVVVSAAAAAAPWRVPLSDGGREERRLFTRSVDCHDPADRVMSAGAGVTTADCALADTGTLVVLASPDQHRLDSLVPPVHIALLRERDIVPGLSDLFPQLASERRFERHAAITFITGPSRTADIELTLTIGVHGPRKVFVVVLQDDSGG